MQGLANVQSASLAARCAIASASQRTPAARLTRPGARSAFVVRAGTISSNDFKNGVYIEVDGAPFRILEFLHVKPGKGSAFVRTKLKHQITGNTVEKTFRAGEKVDEADMNKSTQQYTYAEGDQLVFMNMESYEETRVPKGDFAKFLKEGMSVQVLTWNGKVVDVELPAAVTLKVVDTSGSEKGNTVSGGSKPATLETGAVINVPMFINIGGFLHDNVSVDSRTGDYLSRVTN